MLMRKPSHRNFEYIPRYYKPEEDENVRRKWRMTVKFRSQRKRRRSNKPVYLYLVIFAIILYMYLVLSGVV